MRRSVGTCVLVLRPAAAAEREPVDGGHRSRLRRRRRDEAAWLYYLDDGTVR
jgi:hypothetical protein